VFKSALTTIIGIRHAWVLVVVAESHEGADFGMVSAGWIELTDVGEIHLIHRNDEIELFKIGRLDLPGTTRDGVAVAYEGGGHARVRWRSLMAAYGACGIDVKIIHTPCVIHHLPENNLRSRGAADVPEADEQNAVWRVHVGEIGGYPCDDNPKLLTPPVGVGMLED